jgi:tRNA-specific 2-thiouridylase
MKPVVPPQGARIAVAMSGGVDSSVVAALLIEQGYEVVGMMLTMWHDAACDTENRCCTPESVAEARRIAGSLGFPFYVIDAKKCFFDAVIQNFIAGYSTGITPNPCLLCNRDVRWNILLREAEAAGCQYLATGHYARLILDYTGVVHLLTGLDTNKDQSYVLSFLSQSALAKTFLPIGDMEKTTVREHARRFGLEVAEKPDSQDLCFLGNSGLRDFLSRMAPESLLPGKILLPNGTVIGEHQGLSCYTIGQRKGIGLAAPKPLYVIEKNLKTNTLVVGYEEHLGRCKFNVINPTWTCQKPPQSFPFECHIKTRYKAKPALCTVSISGEYSEAIGCAETISTLTVQTAEPIRDITAGQGAVLYHEDEVIGAGIIEI